MSTEVTPFTTAKPAAAFVAALGAAPQESLADGIGVSYGVIHYKGKVWSLQYRGQTYVVTRSDDGSPANFIDLIILRQAKTKSKSYYAKWDPNATDGGRPLCAALDGIAPDPDVQQKQSESCAVCPRNVFKQNAEGRTVKECSDYKRLAVMLLPSLTTRLLGAPLLEPVFLRVPAASLNDLGVFGDRMNVQGWHYSSFITRVSFDPKSEYPKMVFTEQQPLTDAEAPVVLEKRDDPQSLRITGEDKISSIPGAARLVSQAQPLKIAAPAVAQPVAAPPQTVTVAPTIIETGFGGVPTPAPNPTPAPQASLAALPADVGETTESDAALDAKIKSILGG